MSLIQLHSANRTHNLTKDNRELKDKPKKRWPLLKLLNSQAPGFVISMADNIARYLDFPPRHLKPELGLGVEMNLKEKGNGVILEVELGTMCFGRLNFP